MRNVIVALIACLAVGCVSSARVSSARIEALEKRLAESEEANLRLRKANAEGYEPPGHPNLPAQNPKGPDLSSQKAGGTTGTTSGTSTGTMWARQRHGVYMGTVGEVPRQMTQGRKVKFENLVCDEGSRNAWSRCWDVDESGEPDLNTWLSFQIDGQPVVCDSGYQHPATGVSLLPPGQSCHVELGRGRRFKLRIQAYRNSGSGTYVVLDARPDRSALKTIEVGDRSVAYYGVDETRF